MSADNLQWRLLIMSLPSPSTAGRMRIWRALKASGSGALRDGAYLLPDCAANAQVLSELAEETRREGGSAWVLTVLSQSSAQHAEFCALFDRSDAYAELVVSFSESRAALADLAPTAISRLMRKLRRDYEALRAIDYFPGEASAHAEAVWNDLSNTTETMLSRGEPKATDKRIPRLSPKDFQHRIWATRRRLWVDRVASAWLIRRFIDLQATFVWIDTPAECPKDAFGFDFDGAVFTHVGDRVTFEVLLTSFGLENDRGLQRIAAMVHALDVGGPSVQEAIGFEAILSGARQRIANDDQLLAEVSPVLDSLHAHFSTSPKN